MKTSILALVFGLMFMLPTSSDAGVAAELTDPSRTTQESDTLHDDEMDLSVNENLLFQEKVYIHIYDHSEKPLISGSFSRKELNENTALKALLRKSTRFLNIDQHYYYFVNEG